MIPYGWLIVQPHAFHKVNTTQTCMRLLQSFGQQAVMCAVKALANYFGIYWNDYAPGMIGRIGSGCSGNH